MEAVAPIFANLPMSSLHYAFGKLFATDASGNLYTSADSGKVWHHDTLITGANGQFLSVGNTVFLCGSSGVLKSVDSGRTWKSCNSGLGTGTVRTITQSAHYLSVGLYGGGVFRSSDLGTTWVEANSGLADKRVYAVAGSGMLLYAACDGHNVFVSTNEGASWLKSSLFPSIVGFCFSGAVSYAYGDGIHQSNDSGLTWKQINSTMAYNSTVTRLSIDAGTFYASTCGGGVYTSKNLGTSWERSSIGLNSQYIECLTNDGCTLYSTTPYALYKKGDYDSEWRELTFGSWGHWADVHDGVLSSGIQGFHAPLTVA